MKTLIALILVSTTNSVSPMYSGSQEWCSTLTMERDYMRMNARCVYDTYEDCKKGIYGTDAKYCVHKSTVQ